MTPSTSLIQAATVLINLPKLQAAKVLSRFEPDNVKTVLKAMTRLDDVSASQISLAMQRFSLETRGRRGTADSTELNNVQRQVDSALTDHRSQLKDRAEAGCPFAFLIDVIPLVRIHLLSDEHPKNVAIVLSKLPPSIASSTLKGLDRQLQISVVKRICELEELPKNEIAELRFALKQRLNRLLNSGHVNENGINSAIRLLQSNGAESHDELLAQIKQTDPELAYKLQRSAFKLERISTLMNAEIKMILRHSDSASWAPALKNAPKTLVEKILANMTPEASTNLMMEISKIGFVDPQIEELAKQNIIQVVLRLAREGKIELRKNEARTKTKNRDTKLKGEVFPQVGQFQSAAFACDATSFMS